MTMKNIEITVIGPGKVNLGNTTVPANSTARVSWKPGLQLLPDTDVICTRILYDSKDVLTANDIARKATIFKIPTDIEKVLICFEKQEFAEVVFSINLEPGILKPPYDTMPDSVKIDIRCGNEPHLPKSVFYTQGKSIDLRDIAEEIDGLEYTFSQPNYLRDIQDPRDISNPQDPEPSTEALLGDNLDQLMRYSRLSGYRGDHFVNN